MDKRECGNATKEANGLQCLIASYHHAHQYQGREQTHHRLHHVRPSDVARFGHKPPAFRLRLE